jgi:ketosteroid isomerase-like protein
MSGEFTAPGPEQAVRRRIEAANRSDYDEAVALFSGDAVWDMTAVGLGLIEGRDAIRGFFQDWQGSYEEFEMRVEDFHVLDDGVTLVEYLLRGRPTGSTGLIELRYAGVETWADGLIRRATLYLDVDEARAGAERLLEGRG